MSPDPTMLYMTQQHRESIAGLVYSVMSGKGVVALIGDVGSGKTTALAKLGQLLPPTIRVASIFHTTLNSDEFWELLLLEFGLNEDITSKAQRLTRLREFLAKQRKAGIVPALIMDEAHKLSIEVLEEIRLLSNLEENNVKLLTIVLAGQLELSEVLSRDDMRQLKQRVAVRLSIKAMQAEDVRPYIQHRWNCAGAIGAQPFTNEAVECVIRYSGCIPRLVNSICDNALLLAFAESSKTVEASHVRVAVADLDLSNSELHNELTTKPQPAETISASLPKPGAPASAVRPEPEFQAVVPSVRGVPAFCEVPVRKQSRLNRWVSRMRTV